MQRIVALLLTTGIIFGGLGYAFAGEPNRHGNKFRERIETLTMWKMMEALDLDKETSNKILALRKKFETKRSTLEQSIDEDLQKLRGLVKNADQAAGDKEMAGVIESIRGKRRQLDALRDEHFTDMSKVLSVRQQAKLIIFLKDFRREIREMVRASMRNRPLEGESRFGDGGGGPGPERPGRPPKGRFGPPPDGPAGPPPGPGNR